AALPRSRAPAGFRGACRPRGRGGAVPARCRTEGGASLWRVARSWASVRGFVGVRCRSPQALGLGRAAKRLTITGDDVRMVEPSPLRSAEPVPPAPPGSWWGARQALRFALAPVERFLAIEAASGILLLVSAA